MNGLEKITGKITDDARADAKAKTDAAAAACAETEREYEKRAADLRDAMLADAEREAVAAVARVKSTAAIEKRNVVIGERSALVDEAFALAADDIKNMEPEKYLSLLNEILSSVLLNQSKAEQNEREDYGESELDEVSAYEVILNKSDREKYGLRLIDAVKAGLYEKADADILGKLVLSEKTAEIDGGMLLRYGDIEVNCSMSMIFSRLREALETEVYRILFKA